MPHVFKRRWNPILLTLNNNRSVIIFSLSNWSKLRSEYNLTGLWRLPTSGEKTAFFTFLLFWSSFRLISTGMAKNEFCNNKSIFSDLSDVIKQRFWYTCPWAKIWTSFCEFFFDRSFFLALVFPFSLYPVFFPTLSSFFYQKLNGNLRSPRIGTNLIC